jgi:hypothetical protein
MGGLLGKVLDNAEGILDKVITTDEERDQAKLALKKLLLEAEKEAFAKEVEDRKSARDITKSIDLGEFEISFISSIFGAMSAKVNTIIDFFFGGSSKKNEQTNNN